MDENEIWSAVTTNKNDPLYADATIRFDICYVCMKLPFSISIRWSLNLNFCKTVSVKSVSDVNN